MYNSLGECFHSPYPQPSEETFPERPWIPARRQAEPMLPRAAAYDCGAGNASLATQDPVEASAPLVSEPGSKVVPEKSLRLAAGMGYGNTHQVNYTYLNKF
jgi:hypothetical protein